MKIIKEHNNQATCSHCDAVLEWEPHDLRWTHTDPNYYYVVCPCCEGYIWFKQNDRLDKMWKENGGKI